MILSHIKAQSKERNHQKQNRLDASVHSNFDGEGYHHFFNINTFFYQNIKSLNVDHKEQLSQSNEHNEDNFPASFLLLKVFQKICVVLFKDQLRKTQSLLEQNNTN